MGVQPLVLADKLGHENIKTTLVVSSHLYRNNQTTVCEIQNALTKLYVFSTHGEKIKP